MCNGVQRALKPCSISCHNPLQFDRLFSKGRAVAQRLHLELRVEGGRE